MPARDSTPLLPASLLVIFSACALVLCCNACGKSEPGQLEADLLNGSATTASPAAAFASTLPSPLTLGKPGAPPPGPSRQSSAINDVHIPMDQSIQRFNAIEVEDSIAFFPESGPAFALFSMEAPVPDLVSIEADGSNGLWLLLADFDSGRWTQATRFANDTATINFAAVGQPLDGSGKFYCAVVSPPGLNTQLTDITISYEGPGDVWYVDPEGSDSGSGSYFHPFLTLQHAADVIGPDSLVIVRPGTYQGFVENQSGLPDGLIHYFGEEGAVISGNPMHDFGIWLNGNNQTEVVIEGFTVQNFANAQVVVGGSGINSGIKLLNLKVRSSVYPGIDVFSSSGVLIEGCEVTHSDSSAAITCTSCSTPTIRNCDLGLNCRHGVALYSTTAGLIEKSYIHDLIDGEAILLDFASDDTTIRSNLFSFVPKDGIYVAPNDALPEEALERLTVVGNTLGNVGLSNGFGISVTSTRDSVFRNNLIFGFGKGGMLVTNGFSKSSDRNQILYNTIIQFDDGSAPEFSKAALTLNEAVESTVVSSNVLSAPYASMRLTSFGLFGLQSDHNVFSTGIEIDTIVFTLPDWQTFFEQDLLSAEDIIDNVFADYANSNFHLKAGSPAIGLADVGYMPGGDLEGTVRPQGGTPDSGCFEFVE